MNRSSPLAQGILPQRAQHSLASPPPVIDVLLNRQAMPLANRQRATSRRLQPTAYRPALGRRPSAVLGCSSSLQPPASSLPRGQWPVVGNEQRTTNNEQRRSRHRDRPGFTLIEMLVSLAITLIMMGAVVSLFSLISDSVSGSRSIIEISERLRATRNRLQADLQGATATMKPPLRPEADEGYFELIEGPMTDSTSLDFSGGSVASATALGDVDDVLMFTVRSRGEPFVGRYSFAPAISGDPPVVSFVESQVAEVIYFCDHAQDAAGGSTDGTLYIDSSGVQRRLYTLYRRVLLVAPKVQASLAVEATVANALQIEAFFQNFDISAKRFIEVTPGNFAMVPNTLGDLTKRENRFAHYGVFPYNVNGPPPAAPFPDVDERVAPFFAASSPRLGDDVLLTNVLSFDVQVYDPLAPVDVTSSTALTPTDAGYPVGATGPLGAYVDLGWMRATAGGQFDQFALRDITSGAVTDLAPVLPIFVVSATPWYTYDTWSLHYENNGIPENSSHVADAATNGLDDLAVPVGGGAAVLNGVVDDPTELDTQAPFAAPLRGIKVTIRVYEPGSQQVRQVTVVQDFLPE